MYDRHFDFPHKTDCAENKLSYYLVTKGECHIMITSEH